MILFKINSNLPEKSFKSRAQYAWLTPVLMLLLTACTPKIKTNVLTFLFDGVPEKKIKDTSVKDSGIHTDSVKTTTVLASPGEIQGYYYHKPYKERACIKCHSTEMPGKNTSSQDEICYTCHTDFKNKYDFVHGPVASGFCTTCHAPHFSEHKHLLTRESQAICLNCHDKELVFANKVHANIGETDCISCHNPHGGANHFILKEMSTP